MNMSEVWVVDSCVCVCVSRDKLGECVLEWRTTVSTTFTTSLVESNCGSVVPALEGGSSLALEGGSSNGVVESDSWPGRDLFRQESDEEAGMLRTAGLKISLWLEMGVGGGAILSREDGKTRRRDHDRAPENE